MASKKKEEGSERDNRVVLIQALTVHQISQSCPRLPSLSLPGRLGLYISKAEASPLLCPAMAQLCNSLKGGWGEVGAGLFYHACSEMTRGNGLKLRQGRFRLDIGKIFFTVRVVRHCNRLPRQEVQLPALQVFKQCLGLVLGDGLGAAVVVLD